MKCLMVVAALAVTPMALAHELDVEAKHTDPIAIEKSKALPGTVIVKTNKSDPNDVQVAFVKEKLKPGQKVKNLKFEKIARDAEKVGIAYDSGNELDVTTSTASWGFGWRGPWGGGIAVGRPGWGWG